MSRTYKGRMFFISLMIFLVLVMVGCGTTGVASGSTSPAQTLQNSAVAMTKLKSTHVDLQTLLDVQPGSSASAGASGISFNVTGHGDASTPAEASMTLSLGTQPYLSLISVGSKVYVQSKNGTWYFIDKSKIKDNAQNFFSQSIATRLGQTLVILQSSKLTDHGLEVLKGDSVALDHITAVPDQQTLKELTNQLEGLLPTNVQSVQNALKQATLDMWIDPSTWYVHQARLDITGQVNMSAVTSSISQTSTSSSANALPFDMKVQLNFSKFNQPVNIQAPQNAVALPD